MDSIYDNVLAWNITITGVNNDGKTLIGGRAIISKEMFEVEKFPAEEFEFKQIWEKTIEKSKTIDIKDVKNE